MGDEAKSAVSTVNDALKTAQEALKSLASAWPGEAEAAEEKPAPPTDQAARTLKWARGKYDGLIKWVLGCFTAVGLLIFGSVPFVDLGSVDMLYAIAGLVAAGLGIGIVIWATTRALEPEDASLGEIKQTLTDLGDESPSKIEQWANPRLAEAFRLRDVLASDPAAHFGPGVASVSGLLDEISLREHVVLGLETGWEIEPGIPDYGATEPDAIEPEMRAHLKRVWSAIAGDDDDVDEPRV